MTPLRRLSYLRVALIISGIACLAFYPLMLVWPSGWAWHVGHSEYPMMIAGLYATLGAFLLLAARNPLANISLIWFTVWSSIAHGGNIVLPFLPQTWREGHPLRDLPTVLPPPPSPPSFSPPR